MADWTYTGTEDVHTPTLAPYIADGNTHWTPGETKQLSGDAPALSGPHFSTTTPKAAPAAPAHHAQ